MLLDHHRVAALLELTRIAGSSEAERIASTNALETLLIALYTAATPVARERFLQRMEGVPAAEKPWAALRRQPAGQIALGPTTPPVVLLVLGQRDDDPDAAEDGNRLPDRDSKAGEPWQPLYAALDRWDTAAIAKHIGPMGWQLPLDLSVPRDEGLAPEYPPRTVVFQQGAPASATSPASGNAPEPTPPYAPTSQSAPPGSASYVLPVVVGLGAATLGGALVLAFTRTRSAVPEVTP